MNLKTLLTGAICALTFGASAQAAVLLNAGFETGDLTGWTGDDRVTVVDLTPDGLGGSTGLGVDFEPTEGNYFAQLEAGEVAGDYTLLRSDTFTLDARSRVSLDAAFLAFDYFDETSPYNDDAFVRIVGAGGGVLFTSTVQAVGSLWHTPWTNVSRTLEAGSYYIEAGVRNVGEGDGAEAAMGYASLLLLDNVEVAAAAVPEPTTWALMILGFGFAGSVLRRRRVLA